MAKHAKPYVSEDHEYSFHVTEVHHGMIVIDASSLDEAMRLARDIYADRAVTWAGSTVQITPEGY